MNNTSIIPGSLGAIAQANNKSLAETFCQCDHIIIMDTSGSMYTNDSRGGKSRYDVALEELTQLQKNLPGKVAIISFSDDTVFCPSGVPAFMGGGTQLTRALNFVKVADLPGMDFILVSDGDPDDRTGALKIAATFTQKINVIYVGPESRPDGRDFLAKLANATGGTTVTASSANNLLSKIETLLLTATAN